MKSGGPTDIGRQASITEMNSGAETPILKEPCHRKSGFERAGMSLTITLQAIWGLPSGLASIHGQTTPAQGEPTGRERTNYT
jgi:hypothetical protein